MGTGSTLTGPLAKVLPLTEWPARHLEKLDQLFHARAPSLGVHLFVPPPVDAGVFSVQLPLRHSRGRMLSLATAPAWLTGPLCKAFPVGFVLRVCEHVDLVALDTVWRLGGWDAVAHLLDAQLPPHERPAP